MGTDFSGRFSVNVPYASVAGTITGSYATGAVWGSDSVGGLVGHNLAGTISGSCREGRGAQGGRGCVGDGDGDAGAAPAFGCCCPIHLIRHPLFGGPALTPAP